ncbi:MAG: type II secretion system protein [Bdellovibrionales bacterium]
MSILEVLFAVAMVGVLAMVLSSVMETMAKANKQTRLTATLQQMRNNIEKYILDGRAWNQTIADPTVDATGDPGVAGADPVNRAIPQLACLANRDGTCTHITPPATAPATPETVANAYWDAAPFIDMPILSDSAGRRYVNSLAPTAGFTSNGAPCNTFVTPPAIGNDGCPIRWELKVVYTCPAGPGNCVDPNVMVVAILYYNPSNINPQLASIVNETRYRVIVTRGPRGENRAERFEATHEGAGAGNGGGACTPNGWTNIPLNTINDPTIPVNATLVGGNVRVVSGTYTCTATTSCFSCGALGIRVRNVGVGILATGSSILVPNFTMGIATANNFTFSSNGPADIRIEQFCANDPVSGSVNFGLGMALPDYGQATRFSTLTCTRTF